MSGIVGWGRCDFIPEIFDRLKYHFAQSRYDGEGQWYEFVSRMPFIYPPPPPLYSITCMYYHYNLRKNTLSPEYHYYLESMLHTVSDALIEQSRDRSVRQSDEYGDKDDGDHWSQGLHSEASPTAECSVEDPFTDDSEYPSIHSIDHEITSEQAVHYFDTPDSSSRCTSWDDGETIPEVIDAFSVA